MSVPASTPQPVTRLTPERRTTLFYATLFTTAGAANSYGGIWFAHMGLSAAQISVVNALPVFCLLVLNLAVGRLADRATDWRQVIALAMGVAGLLPLGLFFVNGFWGIALFWTLAAVTLSTAIPVVDAAAMRMCARHGSDFGAMRAWGTIGYLVVIVGSGYLLAALGPGAYLPLFCGLALLRAGIAQALPRFRAPAGTEVVVPGATQLRQLMRPWFVLPLAGFAIVNGSHTILNAFQGLLWAQQGIPVPVIGLLIALGGASEALMFFLFRRLLVRWTPRVLLTVSGVITVLRWAAMGLAPGVPVLIGLQALHGVTYGLGFMASVHFINARTSEDISAQGQSFSVMLQLAMSVLALLGFGGVVDRLGAQAYFVSAGFAMLAVVLFLFALRTDPPKASAVITPAPPP
ncbi:MAG: hypothetical protein GC146_10480 [Limimaricola sp.]|uniref:MFS transporter n=1 Tax=Limimaricola sp. TaxID=2211665 RepID=UPI001D5F1B5F|nr:MFS transporter [Limimaricola sp.]MBI1417636.1 hypothetical protein [Limimaricola sp.]